MRSLAGSVADGMQLMPLKFLSTTDMLINIRKVKGR